MNTSELTRKHRRLPGEIAFDRCFLPLVALFLLYAVSEIAAAAIAWIVRSPSKPLTEAQFAHPVAPPPPLWYALLWNVWFCFALGLVLAVLWFRALVSLIRAWRDPSSRVLRFSASVLLIPFARITYQLLLAPFQ